LALRAQLRPDRLLEVAGLFGRLGATAFGGPAAYIALMEDEVVRRRGWVTRERFLDLLSAAHLVPGPNATELAIHLGYVRAGFPGLVVAGVAFTLPAALIVSVIASLYVRLGGLPEFVAVLAGMKPAVFVVVLGALWRFARTLVTARFVGALALAATAALLLGAGEISVLVAAGLVAAARSRLGGGALRCSSAPLVLAQLAPLVPAVAQVTLAGMFGIFLKIGSVLYGSGYVLFAFLRADFVERLGWLTDAQLLDAVAVGQVTPGPLFTTATFIGFVLAGAPGAAVATIGIFLPSFFFVAVSGPLVARIRSSPAAGAFLDGVNVASLALMATVTLLLARDALTSVHSIAIAAVATLLLRLRVNSAWIVLGGAAAGWTLWALT
jgi:chromate transporter